MKRTARSLRFTGRCQEREPATSRRPRSCQGAWRAVGVDVTIELDGARCFDEKTTDGGMTTTSRTMWFSYADPDMLRTIFYSRNIGQLQRAKYNDPEVDKTLLDAAARPTTRRPGKELYFKDPVARCSTTSPQSRCTIRSPTTRKQAKLEGDLLDFLASYVWINDAHFK